MSTSLITLWAPHASSAQVWTFGAPPEPGRWKQSTSSTDLGAHPHEMTRLDDEHFSTELPIGTAYLLGIDHLGPHPDPRSRRQPWGVHGPSMVWSPDAYPWQDREWTGGRILGGVSYEIHPGTFTPEGTLDAAAEKLAYLAGLGIEVVVLMPVNAFPDERGWGYDGVDLYAVQESYGGPDALQRFVDAAHQEQIAVCLDVVYNHFGPSGFYATHFAP